MEKSPFQTIFLVATMVTCVVTVYQYLSQEEHRGIQKEIDRIRLAEMKSKIATGQPVTPSNSANGK